MLSKSFLAFPVTLFFLGSFLLPSLTGCQSTRVRVHDCKVGDWGVIGNKDGDQGLDPRFDERRKFCADVDDVKISADANNNYRAGWEQGNFQYWLRLGTKDGAAAKAITHFMEQSTTEVSKKNRTPSNQFAYQQGWAIGNANHWRILGDKDGQAGQPASMENARAAAGLQIGFNRLSYLDGWQAGNQSYWGHLGYLDAHDGRADTEFKQHAAVAKREGVQLREDAYLSAWNTVS